MKDSTINNSAYKLIKNDEITTRIKQLKRRTMARNDISKDRIAQELPQHNASTHKTRHLIDSISIMINSQTQTKIG